MAKEVTVTCVGCPLACTVNLKIDEKDEVIEVSGNGCKQGKEYAIEEYKSPVRVFTATVLTQGSEQPLLPVRTDTPIPRAKLQEGMSQLAGVRAKPPVKSHDVIISNFLDTRANLVATADLLS